MPLRRGPSFTSQYLLYATHQMRMIDDGLSEDQSSLSLSSSYTSTQQANTAGLPGMLTLSGELNKLSPAGWRLWPGLSSVSSGAWLLQTTHLKPSFPRPLCLQNSLTNIRRGSVPVHPHQWPLSNTFLTHLRYIPILSFNPYADLHRRLCFLVDNLYGFNPHLIQFLISPNT